MMQTYCYYLAICVIDERVRGKEKIKFMARVALCCETALPVPRTFALQVPSLLHSDISTHAHTETLFCLSFYTSTSLSLLKTFSEKRVLHSKSHFCSKSILELKIKGRWQSFTHTRTPYLKYHKYFLFLLVCDCAIKTKSSDIFRESDMWMRDEMADEHTVIAPLPHSTLTYELPAKVGKWTTCSTSQ